MCAFVACAQQVLITTAGSQLQSAQLHASLVCKQAVFKPFQDQRTSKPTAKSNVISDDFPCGKTMVLVYQVES